MKGSSRGKIIKNFQGWVLFGFLVVWVVFFFDSGWDIVRSSVAGGFLTQRAVRANFAGSKCMPDFKPLWVENHYFWSRNLVRIFIAVLTLVVLCDDTDFLPPCKLTK